ncbi:hypothetical protein [Anatilimnocola floriformis]|uniref:hypothetical protein n=1 Tax=Anatilimnocola floriformis TaxID=2948575 RepID=UPI0020C27A58|nr:hypothetical protein [Anatilimnocola floriformis]
MPISVVCGACKAKLNIPDNLAGKRAKCPKCQTPFQIPAADAPAVVTPATLSPSPAPTVPVKQPPAATPVSVVANATPAEAKKTSVNPMILAAAGGGGLLMLIGIVVVALWLASSGGQAKQSKLAQGNPAHSVTPAESPLPPGPPVATPVTTPPTESTPAVSESPAVAANEPSQAANSVAPAGWIDFADEAMGFRVAFPSQPSDDETATPDDKDDDLAASFKRDMLKSLKEKGALRMLRATHQQRVYSAQATRLPLVGMSPDQYFDRLEMSISTMHPGFELVGKSQRGKQDGHRYCDFKLQQTTDPKDSQKLVRMIPASGIIYGVVVEGKKVEPTDQDVSRFFTSLKLSAPKKESAVTVIANPDPTNDKQPNPEGDPAAPANPKRPTRAPEKTIELPPPLGPPFAGKKTDFTICFPEKATVKTVDTFKAISDAKRRNETKNRWLDDKAFYESLTAEVGGRTYLITAWRDRKLTGNDATNAQLRRIKDLLADQVKGNSRPSIVNSDLAKKVSGRSLYTRRYRADDKLIVYQEVREGTFSCVVQVESPRDVDERTDPQIWAFFNSLEVSP